MASSVVLRGYLRTWLLCYLRWNLGGPDEGLSMRQQGEMLADVLGKDEAKLLGVRQSASKTVR